MTVQNYDQQAFHLILNSGGKHTFIVNADDIDNVKGAEFETYASIQPLLTTGFEIPPAMIFDALQQAQIYHHGDFWGRIISAVYAKGGKITYKKIARETYEAVASV